MKITSLTLMPWPPYRITNQAELTAKIAGRTMLSPPLVPILDQLHTSIQADIGRGYPTKATLLYFATRDNGKLTIHKVTIWYELL